MKTMYSKHIFSFDIVITYKTPKNRMQSDLELEFQYFLKPWGATTEKLESLLEHRKQY